MIFDDGGRLLLYSRIHVYVVCMILYPYILSYSAGGHSSACRETRSNLTSYSYRVSALSNLLEYVVSGIKF